VQEKSVQTLKMKKRRFATTSEQHLFFVMQDKQACQSQANVLQTSFV